MQQSVAAEARAATTIGQHSTVGEGGESNDDRGNK